MAKLRKSAGVSTLCFPGKYCLDRGHIVARGSSSAVYCFLIDQKHNSASVSEHRPLLYPVNFSPLYREYFVYFTTVPWCKLLSSEFMCLRRLFEGE